ncbi:MAG TPA: M28 family metallopeptidase, partial [Nevskiaceae bacterium]|nr:M28 family metallopeptidase [Nevskiaceae bacterium]
MSAPSAAPASPTFDADRLMAHIRVLSSDAFEGRAPGTPGDEKTIAYLTGQLQALGLKPGNPDGTFVQKVEMVGIDGRPELTFTARGKRVPMIWEKDYVAVTPHAVPEVTVQDSPLVFVGYGVQAPEYGWDDYKDVDVRGKTVVILINDPAVPDPKDRTQLDPAMFKGKAMTYYGRWPYKYETAARLGAAGAIIVHETIPASYPWPVVHKGWTGEQLYLLSPDKNVGQTPVQSWITLEQARALFEAAGRDFDTLHEAARRKEFRAVALDARMSARIVNTLRTTQSHSVFAALPGSDPVLKDEWIVYNAHWDHLGRNADATGDGIYNGARDNASGTGGVIELARAFRDGPAPKRSILFGLVTAEESGTLGSQYYVKHPLVPIKKTVAAINIDELNVWKPTRDIQVIGMGQSTLEDDLARVAARHGRHTVPDGEAEKGSYYRSDQFNYAKAGIPAIYADEGFEGLEQKNAEFDEKDYHQPSDEIKPDWDLAGAVADLQLLYELGLEVANRPEPPQWKDGSEF